MGMQSASESVQGARWRRIALSFAVADVGELPYYTQEEQSVLAVLLHLPLAHSRSREVPRVGLVPVTKHRTLPARSQETERSKGLPSYKTCSDEHGNGSRHEQNDYQRSLESHLLGAGLA